MEHYLGFLDANKKLEQEKILPKSFVHTKSIKTALSDDVAFICGRKGAGKSAIVTMLGRLKDKKDRSLFEKIKGITEDDYLIFHETMLSDLMANSTFDENSFRSLESCYYEIWRFILEVSALQLVVEALADIEPNHDDYSLISDYLSKLDDSGLGDSVYIAVEEMKIALKEALGSEAVFTMFAFHFKGLRNKKDHRQAIHALDKLRSKIKICIYIDTMENYDIKDYRIYPLRGMCRAVKEFLNNIDTNIIQIKCCLPAELTDDLFTDNLAKYNEYAAYLLWTHSELLEFLGRRYCWYLREENHRTPESDAICKKLDLESEKLNANNFWKNDFWYNFMPGKIFNRFGSPEDSCAYLIRHTQKRPREVLSCMNFIIEKAKSSGEFPMISATSVIEGIHASENLWQLLTSNLSIFNDPKKETSAVDIASDLLTDESFIFSGTEFSRFAKRALSLLQSHDVIDRSDYAKDILLRSGLVGRIIRADNGDPAHIFKLENERVETKYYITEFEYLIPGKVSLSEESLCAVHPILADRLKLKKSDEHDGVVYPIPEENDVTEGLYALYRNHH